MKGFRFIGDHYKKKTLTTIKRRAGKRKYGNILALNIAGFVSVLLILALSVQVKFEVCLPGEEYEITEVTWHIVRPGALQHVIEDPALTLHEL